MGTKATELRNGCFAKALDDEPMFVLLARDPAAPQLVRQWANNRAFEVLAGKRPRSDMDQVHEARQTADNMEEWREQAAERWRTGLFGEPAPGDKLTIDGRQYTIVDGAVTMPRGPMGDEEPT